MSSSGPHVEALAASDGATDSPCAPTAGRVAANGSRIAIENSSLTKARIHMDHGQRYFAAERYGEAAAEFRAGYAVWPLPSFLFNEGLCREGMGDSEKAIQLLRHYLEVDPAAPDRVTVARRLQRLLEPSGVASNGAELRATAIMKSTPSGAPIEIWSPIHAHAKGFVVGRSNRGWQRIVSATTPLQQSMPAGRYHVVIHRCADNRPVETEFVVSTAFVSVFEADLTRGAFHSLLRVHSYELADDDADAMMRVPSRTQLGDPSLNEVLGAHVLIKRSDEAQFVSRGRTPYEEPLERGSYVVRLERAGFNALEREVHLDAGQVGELEFVMTRAEDGVLRVHLTGAPSGEMEVDGRTIGTFHAGQPAETTVRGGHHVVRVRAEGHQSYEATVKVPRGGLAVLHAALAPHPPRTMAWITGVGSVALLGAGIALGVESMTRQDRADPMPDAYGPDRDNERAREGKYLAIGAGASFVVAGILGLISIHGFAKAPRPHSEGWLEPPRVREPVARSSSRPWVRLVPSIGPHQTTLSWVGQF